MLEEIMDYLNNYFLTDVFQEGSFKIENGTVSLSFVKEGQYIRIEGSHFNDGAYQYPLSDLVDEEFEGRITVLAPTKGFLTCVKEVEDYVEADNRNGLQGESFGGYSYTRAVNANGALADWKDVFRGRLNTWRKL